MRGESEPTEVTSLLQPPEESNLENVIQNNRAIIDDWASPTDPDNPKNWKASRKWTCAMIVSSYCLMAPTSATMVVPAMPELGRDLGMTSPAMLQMTLSTYVLGWGLGPLLLGPLSEIFGRAPLLHTGQLGFTVITFLCTLTRNQYLFLVLRFASGMFGSGPTALGAGTLSDLWVSDERGMSLAIYTLMPLLGPTVGTLIGGYMIQYYSWRHIFYSCTAFATTCLIWGLLYLPETFGPMILRRRRMAERRKMGLPTDDPEWRKRTLKLVRQGLARPYVLLGTQIIIQTLALYFAVLFGLYQLSLSTYHALWRDVYGQSAMESSLNYLSISAGLVVGCQVTGLLNDKIHAILKRRNGGIDAPEFRVWLMIPVAVLLPTGLLIYGWSAAYRAHWTLPNLGMAIAASGVIMGIQCLQSYIMDAYPVYAASAMGSLTLPRSMSAFILPTIAPSLINGLGYGGANTLLALGALAVAAFTPTLLFWMGPELRRRSPFAAGDVKVIL